MIEMVVVIAIMTILGVGILAALPQMGGQQIRKAARTIDSMLSDTKTSVMAKGKGYFTLSKDAEGKYYATSADGIQKPLGDRVTLTVTFVDTNGNTHDITESDPLMLTFDKASGAFMERIKEVDPNGNGKPAFSYYTDTYVRSITVSLRDRKRVIVLYPKTGKFEVKQ